MGASSVWSARLLARVEDLWREGLSGREIADTLNAEGREIDATQVLSIVTNPRHRDRFPPKTKEQRRAAQSRAVKARLAAGLEWGNGITRTNRRLSGVVRS